MRPLPLFAPLFVLAACGVDDSAAGLPATAASEQAIKEAPELNPGGKHLLRGQQLDGEAGRSHGGGGSSTGMTFYGGAVMTNPANIYFIWYGNWAGNTATSILPDLANGLGGSPYYNINSTYYAANGTHIPNAATLAGQANDNYSQGTGPLADSAIAAIVSSAITSGALPNDVNGVYMVLTSPDVRKSGFCTSYCGWHTHTTVGGTDIKYAFIGNPATQCMSACAEQTVSPNGNPGADAMASIISHEFEETTSDPDLNAWMDSRGSENADKCAWTFGTTYKTANGSLANMSLSGRDFLIQQNWVNVAPGGCALHYP
jgi:hypothetical protein